MNGYKAYTEFLARYGRGLLALTAVLMVVSVVGICRVHIDTDFTVFMPVESAQLEKLHFAAQKDHRGDRNCRWRSENRIAVLGKNPFI